MSAFVSVECYIGVTVPSGLHAMHTHSDLCLFRSATFWSKVLRHLRIRMTYERCSSESWPDSMAHWGKTITGQCAWCSCMHSRGWWCSMGCHYLFCLIWTLVGSFVLGRTLNHEASQTPPFVQSVVEQATSPLTANIPGDDYVSKSQHIHTVPLSKLCWRLPFGFV